MNAWFWIAVAAIVAALAVLLLAIEGARREAGRAARGRPGHASGRRTALAAVAPLAVLAIVVAATGWFATDGSGWSALTSIAALLLAATALPVGTLAYRWSLASVR